MKRVQCKACPWRKGVVPDRDIHGYCVDKHKALEDTIAEPASLRRGSMRAMACHESKRGAEVECVGWVIQQLGPGNNIALRIAAMDGRYRDWRTVGPQHERFEDTLPDDE